MLKCSNSNSYGNNNLSLITRTRIQKMLKTFMMRPIIIIITIPISRIVIIIIKQVFNLKYLFQNFKNFHFYFKH